MCISGGWSFSYADYALRIVEVISRRSALPRAFRRYISRLFRVVVFWLDDPPHSPSTHVIGLPLTWSAICSTSATTVCESRLSTWMMHWQRCSRSTHDIIGHSNSYHSIYIYSIYDILDVGMHTRSCVLIGLLGFHLDGVSRLISPGNREPRHCSLLS